MRIIQKTDLFEGMILGKDISIDNITILNKYDILKEQDLILLNNILEDSTKIWILDLKELKPLLYISSSFTRSYIDYTIMQFEKTASIDISISSWYDTLYNYTRQFLFTNRDILYEVMVLKSNHQYTFSHSLNVALYALTIGLSLELSEEELHNLLIGGILHDIGKLQISNTLLNKVSKLSDSEFKTLQMHPCYGYTYTHSIEYISEPIESIIIQHHEKLDGSGYPNKLLEKDITDLSKIITVCDIFDAYISARSYHSSRPPYKGIVLLNEDVSKGKLDKFAVDALTDKIIRFPVNSQVILNTGEYCLVIKDCIGNAPIVMNCANKQIIDLSKTKDVYIKDVL